MVDSRYRSQSSPTLQAQSRARLTSLGLSKVDSPRDPMFSVIRELSGGVWSLPGVSTTDRRHHESERVLHRAGETPCTHCERPSGRHEEGTASRNGFRECVHGGSLVAS